MFLQSAVRAIYPLQCTACDEPSEGLHGLCSACWQETEFIIGTVCDTCGAPLPGDNASELAHCDECLTTARPWSRGRSVFVYKGTGRSLVLRLKHGDRSDLIPTLAQWVARSVQPILPKDPLFVPVPLHWTRLLRRRYNQAALISQAVARLVEGDSAPEALMRQKRTKSLDGHLKSERFAALDGAIFANPRQKEAIAGRSVVLVDDVMTSGATLAACCDALFIAGAQDVCVVTLARVVKDA